MGELQVEDVVAVVQPVADALDDVREVGVPEEAVRVLGHDEGDRHRRPRDERPSRPVRHVVQLADRGLHGSLDLGTDLRGGVDDARHRGPRHAGKPGDLLERGPPRHHHRSVTHTSLPPDGSSLVLMIRAKSKALAFGVRACVS